MKEQPVLARKGRRTATGSVLGSVLFHIFINNLKNNMRQEVEKYINDTKLFGAAKKIVNFKEGLREYMT